jgi:hypothetical protein
MSRYNTLAAPVDGKFALLPEQGKGQQMEMDNRGYCVRCLQDKPRLGGFFVNGMFMCALHERRKTKR